MYGLKKPYHTFKEMFIMYRLDELGVKLPKILLPNSDINMSKWSVVACDQFTSQPEYWDKVARFVGTSPSILHIVLPEIYLGRPDVDQMIQDTKSNMEEYISSDIFRELPEGILLTERNMGGVLRKGVLLAVDLEKYDYRIENKPTIRATEKTLLERIPPRVAIRKDAPLESPHVLVLMDDVNDGVIGPLHELKEDFEKVYDFDLMMNGGHITGYYTNDDRIIDQMYEALAALPVHDGMRFCVGDGNHSLATAKTVWDNAKTALTEKERENNPLRYALCEFVNIHDPGIEFMPIHRVLFKVNVSNCLQAVSGHLNESGIDARIVYGHWHMTDMSNGCQIPFATKDRVGKIELSTKLTPAVIAVVQEALDKYVAETENTSIDYIHGDEAFNELANQYDNLGFYFEPIDKGTFFETVIENGVLPKKTFSMGEAEQKRYYLECRKISII